MKMKCLQGDINQMYTQMDFLERNGYRVSMTGGIPMIDSDDYDSAVKEIYESGIIGWWNYMCELISLQVCTADEFKERLRRN